MNWGLIQLHIIRMLILGCIPSIVSFKLVVNSFLVKTIHSMQKQSRQVKISKFVWVFIEY